MQHLQSIEAIRKIHTPKQGILMVPAERWMLKEEMNSYETARGAELFFLEEIEKADNDLEVLLGDLKDENLQIALGRAYYEDRLSSAHDLRFPPYLPAGRVQFQIGLVETLMGYTTGKTHSKEETGELIIRGEWDANPKVAVITIDDKETELTLQKAIGTYLEYLKASEHEFYKQWLSSKLDVITREYEMLRDTDKTLGTADGRKIQPSLLLFRYSDFVSESVRRIIASLDEVYYQRALNFLLPVRKMYDILGENEYSKRYLIPGLVEYTSLIKQKMKSK